MVDAPLVLNSYPFYKENLCISVRNIEVVKSYATVNSIEQTESLKIGRGLIREINKICMLSTTKRNHIIVIANDLKNSIKLKSIT